MPDGEHQIVNLSLAGVRCARSSGKPGETAEPWGDEVSLYFEKSENNVDWCYFFRQNSSWNRGYYRGVLKLQFYRSQHHQLHLSKITHLRLHPQVSLLELVCSPINYLCSMQALLIKNRPVLHPAGNIAELLVSAGLARVVDWHAGMLGAGMEKLRAAERIAKQSRLCLYANAPAASKDVAGAASGQGASVSGTTFDATVVRVWSADTISVLSKEPGSKPRRLQLSSTRGPR